MENIGILDAGIVALLGWGVVFVGIIFLMVVVIGMGKIFTAVENRNKATAPDPIKDEPAPAAAEPAPAAPTAPGSAGALKLHDVEPKTAAMLMAIVANKMGKPLNELRFISIKEVK